MDNGRGMIKKVRFSLDLRDVIEKSKRENKILDKMDGMTDELIDKLVDDMISTHIKDFVSSYIKQELGSGGLEFNGDILL
jgi:hypothetical protein